MSPIWQAQMCTADEKNSVSFLVWLLQSLTCKVSKLGGNQANKSYACERDFTSSRSGWFFKPQTQAQTSTSTHTCSFQPSLNVSSSGMDSQRTRTHHKELLLQEIHSNVQPKFSLTQVAHLYMEVKWRFAFKTWLWLLEIVLAPTHKSQKNNYRLERSLRTHLDITALHEIRSTKRWGLNVSLNCDFLASVIALISSGL